MVEKFEKNGYLESERGDLGNGVGQGLWGDILSIVYPPAVEPNSASVLELWNTLKRHRTPASLPSGAVLSITVEDPRLSFPPCPISKLLREEAAAIHKGAAAAVEQQVAFFSLSL